MTPKAPSAGDQAGDARVPLRIALNPNPRTPVDGAWWPQSRDLQVEGADLIDNFPVAAGRVSRVLFSRPDWDLPDTRVRRIDTATRRVKAGSFPEDDTHVMITAMSSGQRLRLLVIPSATAAEEADDLMHRAADEHNELRAAELLEL